VTQFQQRPQDDRKRRRSRMIKLVLLGGAVAFVLPYAVMKIVGPGTPVEGQPEFYANAEQCTARWDAALCRDTLDASRKEHLRSAPAFASRESCESRFGAGNCEWQSINPRPEQVQAGAAPPAGAAAPSSGGWFMPAMLGFVMGQAFAGAPNYLRPLQPGPQGACPPPPGAPPNPACPTGSSSTRTGSTSSSYRSSSVVYAPIYRDSSNSTYSGRTSLPSSSVTHSAVSRGGFGSTARSHSSSSSSS
jgi:uncharacterized protein YgiB involved in biofilm formation